MTFLRNLFCGQPKLETTANLQRHDEIITDLATELHALRNASPEPFAARIRGDYPRRRVRVVRINPRSAEHHG